MEKLDKQAAIIHIRGKVQGVGFRFYTKRTAEVLNIKGFVRNERDGSVYIFAQGEKQDMASFMDWCKNGPDRSIVKSMDIIETEPIAELNSFLIN